jgi:hypothetical protein
VGPPRQGKTTISRLLAEKLGWKHRVSNVQYLNPEEIGGIPLLPKGRDEGQAVRWTLPSLLTDEMLSGERYLWLIDEIDKAHEDAMGCLLSLFDHQRRIHDTKLPDSVRLVAALNEPDALIEALAGRFMYLAFPTASDMSGRLTSLHAGFKRLGETLYTKVPEVKFPTRPSSPEATYALAAWSKYPTFWTNEAVRSRIVRGLFPLTEVPEVMMYLEAEGGSAEALTREEFKDWLLNSPPSTVARQLILQCEAMWAADKQRLVDALTDIRAIASDKSTSDELKRLFKRFDEEGRWRINSKRTDKETALMGY